MVWDLRREKARILLPSLGLGFQPPTPGPTQGTTHRGGFTCYGVSFVSSKKRAPQKAQQNCGSKKIVLSAN